MHDAGKPCNPKIILLIMPLAIMLILSFSMNKACQEILRAIALGLLRFSKLEIINSV